MSYNISSVKILKINAYMLAGDIILLHSNEHQDLPESCFLKDLYEEASDKIKNSSPLAQIKLTKLNWCHSWSGMSFDVLINNIAPMIKGNAEVVFIWEGGDSISGLKINDGIVTKCDVEFVLREKE